MRYSKQKFLQHTSKYQETDETFTGGLKSGAGCWLCRSGQMELCRWRSFCISLKFSLLYGLLTTAEMIGSQEPVHCRCVPASALQVGNSLYSSNPVMPLHKKTSLRWLPPHGGVYANELNGQRGKAAATTSVMNASFVTPDKLPGSWQQNQRKIISLFSVLTPRHWRCLNQSSYTYKFYSDRKKKQRP